MERAQEIFVQHYGFEEQKKEILERMRNNLFSSSISKQNLILPTFCLVGPPGIGKTSFFQVLAQVLDKPLLVFNSETKISALLGTSFESYRNEGGRIIKFLIQESRPDPLILFDEIDKFSIQDHLSPLLDSTQNHRLYERYLDLELDFSLITFAATANELGKISPSLLQRMKVVELPPYTLKQKKEIGFRFSKKIISDNNLGPEDFKITDEAFDSLINKTCEKGVRQLKSMLENNIFHYFLSQRLIKPEAKIEITSKLVNQLVPQSPTKVDQEEPKKSS